jgi:hypothetical protein
MVMGDNQMKRLLPIALILYQTTTIAQPLAVTPNVTGGYTVLTDEDCIFNKDQLQAYATNEKGDVSKACWYPKGDFIYFVPKNGKLRRLPMDQFEIVVPVKKVKQGSKINV